MAVHSYQAGELVLVRARILVRCSDYGARSAVAAIMIADGPESSFIVNTFAPFGEIARPQAIDRLLMAGLPQLRSPAR